VFRATDLRKAWRRIHILSSCCLWQALLPLLELYTQHLPVRVKSPGPLPSSSLSSIGSRSWLRAGSALRTVRMSVARADIGRGQAAAKGGGKGGKH
jgi:hypothetical protein